MNPAGLLDRLAGFFPASDCRDLHYVKGQLRVMILWTFHQYRIITVIWILVKNWQKHARILFRVRIYTVVSTSVKRVPLKKTLGVCVSTFMWLRPIAKG
jgi:hypothetical protein